MPACQPPGESVIRDDVVGARDVLTITSYDQPEVRNPGAYPMPRDITTVLQGLALAGGVTDRGATSRVEIVRIVDGEQQKRKAKLDDVLAPGDTIIVPERFF